MPSILKTTTPSVRFFVLQFTTSKVITSNHHNFYRFTWSSSAIPSNLSRLQNNLYWFVPLYFWNDTKSEAMWIPDPHQDPKFQKCTYMGTKIFLISHFFPDWRCWWFSYWLHHRDRKTMKIQSKHYKVNIIPHNICCHPLNLLSDAWIPAMEVCMFALSVLILVCSPSIFFLNFSQVGSAKTIPSIPEQTLQVCLFNALWCLE